LSKPKLVLVAFPTVGGTTSSRPIYGCPRSGLRAGADQAASGREGNDTKEDVHKMDELFPGHCKLVTLSWPSAPY